MIKVSTLKRNPNNPRQIRDEKFECAVILERMQTAFPDIEIKRIEDAKGKATN